MAQSLILLACLCFAAAAPSRVWVPWCPSSHSMQLKLTPGHYSTAGGPKSGVLNVHIVPHTHVGIAAEGHWGLALPDKFNFIALI